MTKSPVVPDCPRRSCRALSLISVTVAPGMMPPCVSLTVPATVEEVWASEGAIDAQTMRTTVATIRAGMYSPAWNLLGRTVGRVLAGNCGVSVSTV